MPGDDLTTQNVSFNPINPGVAAEPAKTESSSIDSVIEAFKGMKETVVEGAAQFKALFKSSPGDITQTDMKTNSAVSSFFSKTLPEFGQSIIRQATDIKERVDNYVNKDKKYEAEHNKYLPAWGAGGEEKLTVSEKLNQATKPFTSRLSQLSDASIPALATLSEKVDGLRSLIPSPVDFFKSQFEEVELEGSIQVLKEDIHETMPDFLAKVSAQGAVNYKSPEYVHKMKVTHTNMRAELGIQVDEKRQITYDAGQKAVNAWTAKIDPQKTYNFDGAQIKGSKLQELQNKTRVTYDANVVDPKSLSKILKNGAQNAQEQVMSSGRCVVSTDVLTHDHMGNVRQIDKDNPPTFQTYTVNAPNVAYNSEIAKMMKVDGKLDIGKWQSEMTRLFTHAFKEAAKDGLQLMVVPAIGMGVFMPESLKGGAKEAFMNALNDAKKAAGADELEIVVTGSEMEGVASNNDRIHVVGNKDAFGVLAQAIDSNYSAGILNAGDPSAQTGQYAGNAFVQHFAQEESLAVKAPTLMLNQNFSANRRVGDSSRYVAS